jgi:hypothetical protein
MGNHIANFNYTHEKKGKVVSFSLAKKMKKPKME